MAQDLGFFHNWRDALNVANGRAALTGRRYFVGWSRAALAWSIGEVGA